MPIEDDLQNQVSSDATATRWCGRGRHFASVDDFYDTSSFCKACHKAFMNDRRAAMQKTDPVSLRLSELKSNAKRRGIHFGLSKERMKTLLEERACCCCGRTLDNPNDPLSSREIDRVINSTGYTDSNSFALCFFCNRLKGDGTAEDFTRLIAYINKNGA